MARHALEEPAVHDVHLPAVPADRIESFTEIGLKLASGAELAADLVVTATGLNLKVSGGLALCVDGREIATPMRRGR